MQQYLKQLTGKPFLKNNMNTLFILEINRNKENYYEKNFKYIGIYFQFGITCDFFGPVLQYGNFC